MSTPEKASLLTEEKGRRLREPERRAFVKVKTVDDMVTTNINRIMSASIDECPQTSLQVLQASTLHFVYKCGLGSVMYVRAWVRVTDLVVV